MDNSALEGIYQEAIRVTVDVRKLQRVYVSLGKRNSITVALSGRQQPSIDVERTPNSFDCSFGITKRHKTTVLKGGLIKECLKRV